LGPYNSICALNKLFMLEKDIENLIAQNPDDFFPGEELILIGQQHQIEGRRIDILFKDKYSRNIIVEVKRGILTREASGQVAEYFGLLKSANQSEYYEMVLCANVIPKERRLFLEHIGIDCKELGIAKISEIAQKHNYTFLDEKAENIESSQKRESFIPQQNTESDTSVWIFQGNPNRYDVLNALSDQEIGNNIHWLVNQHRNKIKKGHIGLIWMSGAEAGIYAITRINCDPQLLSEFPQERKYWSDQTDNDQKSIRVQMSIIKRLTNSPILKRNLIKIKELENLSILRQFQGTNFPVNNREWEVISRLIPN